MPGNIRETSSCYLPEQSWLDVARAAGHTEAQAKEMLEQCPWEFGDHGPVYLWTITTTFDNGLRTVQSMMSQAAVPEGAAVAETEGPSSVAGAVG